MNKNTSHQQKLWAPDEEVQTTKQSEQPSHQAQMENELDALEELDIDGGNSLAQVV
jgi:hypothetical protein